MMAIGDYPLYDLSKNYCRQCAHQDGSMVSFEERWDMLTFFYVNRHEMDYEVAKQTAYVILKKLPAWKRRW